jgi:hypothetical protein
VLKGKRILLGVTGSIAAYKAVELNRELTKRGAEVQVVMTDALSNDCPGRPRALSPQAPARATDLFGAGNVKAAPAPPARISPKPDRQAGRPRGRHRQACDLPYPSALLCNRSLRRRLRHPDCPGTPRPPRMSRQPWSTRTCSTVAGWVPAARGIPCRPPVGERFRWKPSIHPPYHGKAWQVPGTAGLTNLEARAC